MCQQNILLTSIENVKEFVGFTNNYKFPIWIVTDKYKIDAKSIMGVFSVDISHPITIEIVSEDNSQVQEFLSDIKPFQTEK